MKINYVVQIVPGVFLGCSLWRNSLLWDWEKNTRSHSGCFWCVRRYQKQTITCFSTHSHYHEHQDMLRILGRSRVLTVAQSEPPFTACSLNSGQGARCFGSPSWDLGLDWINSGGVAPVPLMDWDIPPYLWEERRWRGQPSLSQFKQAKASRDAW